MEIQSNQNLRIHSTNVPTVENGNCNIKSSDYHNENSPNFKGAKDKILNGSGWFINKIENGGFLVLFLVQDFLGMTIPRSIAGFLRDKETTGKYNVQEGFEVLGREILTGPTMMAVAPISLWLAAKCAKSTGTNSELIKYFGNNLKDYVSDEKFNRALLNSPNEFRTEFLKSNIRTILEQTVGKEHTTDKSVNYILEQLNNRENIPADANLKRFRGKAKYRNECINNIVEHINELTYRSGDSLETLRKVNISPKENKNLFGTAETFDALSKYTDDSIKANKNLQKLDKSLAESLKHQALGKRVLTTIGIFTATISVLSVLPKIYARNNVAPGARKQPDNTNQVTFKGRNSISEKIGKIVDKNKSKFVSSELEYNGHNFTNTLMGILSIFGIMAPRTYRAYSRAQKDEKGKKDLTEIWENLIRDITSTLSVIFLVPMGTRMAVNSYEKNSGFILMNRDRSVKNTGKKILDLINPYSKSHVYTNQELSSIYDNVNTKEKMINFCKFIDKNGGDLEKILSKSENKDLIFGSSALDLNGLDRAGKNKEITSFFEKLEENLRKKPSAYTGKLKNADEMIVKIMKGATPNKNKILSFARGMNSLPAFITTFAISPYILGWFIPRLTYKNTRRIHKKEDDENKLKANV